MKSLILYFLFLSVVFIRITYSESSNLPLAITNSSIINPESGIGNKLFINVDTKTSNGLGLGIKYLNNDYFFVFSLINKTGLLELFQWQNNYIYSESDYYLHGGEDNSIGSGYAYSRLPQSKFETLWGILNYNSSLYLHEELNIAYFNYRWFYNPFFNDKLPLHGCYLMPAISINSAIKNINLGELHYGSLGNCKLNNYWGFESSLSTKIIGFHNYFINWKFDATIRSFLARYKMLFLNIDYKVDLNVTYLLNKKIEDMEEFKISLGANYEFTNLDGKNNDFFSLYIILFYHFKANNNIVIL